MSFKTWREDDMWVIQDNETLVTTQGKSMSEAITNLQEAVRLYKQCTGSANNALFGTIGQTRTGMTPWKSPLEADKKKGEFMTNEDAQNVRAGVKIVFAFIKERLYWAGIGILKLFKIITGKKLKPIDKPETIEIK